MHQYRGIVRTYRQSSGISTIQDNQSTLTRANLPIQTTPPGNPCFTAPLHGILYVLQTRYVYGCGYVYGPAHFRLRHHFREHCTAASRSLPLFYHVYDASAIIGICNSVLAAVSGWIRLNYFSI